MYNDRPEELENPQLVSIEHREVPEAITKAKKVGFDYVFIDTAGRDLPSTKHIISLSNFVVIPCRPSIADMRASVQSVYAIQEAGCPFAFVVNQSPFQPKRSREAIKSLQALGTVCPTPVVSRAVYQDAQAQGVSVSEYEPDGKAHADIETVWHWVLSIIKKS